MDKEFQNRRHLEPELTWEDCATFVYDGVMEGKLNRDDFIKFFIISGQEMSEPLHVRIIGKALAAFFKRDYTALKLEEKPGVFVIVDNKKYIVSHNDKEITIEEADYIKDLEDNSFIISHETASDAKIAAWEKRKNTLNKKQLN